MVRFRIKINVSVKISNGHFSKTDWDPSPVNRSSSAGTRSPVESLNISPSVSSEIFCLSFLNFSPAADWVCRRSPLRDELSDIFSLGRILWGTLVWRRRSGGGLAGDPSLDAADLFTWCVGEPHVSEHQSAHNKKLGNKQNPGNIPNISQIMYTLSSPPRSDSSDFKERSLTPERLTGPLNLKMHRPDHSGVNAPPEYWKWSWWHHLIDPEHLTSILQRPRPWRGSIKLLYSSHWCQHMILYRSEWLSQWWIVCPSPDMQRRAEGRRTVTACEGRTQDDLSKSGRDFPSHEICLRGRQASGEDLFIRPRK